MTDLRFNKDYFCGDVMCGKYKVGNHPIIYRQGSSDGDIVFGVCFEPATRQPYRQYNGGGANFKRGEYNLWKPTLAQIAYLEACERANNYTVVLYHSSLYPDMPIALPEGIYSIF